ncbi:vesicle-associated membrane protein 714 isoform X2 [Spinacia oleracea]|uniref:Vesicle-associated membrane protein 714 isoform X2 n=1 Tax=Spinacia oleracea TaxID=3562 RepID=A0ABM3QKY4_SPIOL|nr:vesicle-associated membrane protein 714 isoform X2 [Spinacia oleracea]
MAIFYAVVARGTTVLSEFCAVTGNVGAVARRILEKLPPEADSRLCFSQDRYIFHIYRADGLIFLCMANDTFGRRIPFSYLEEIHMRFMKNYGKIAQHAPAYAVNDEFSRVLHQQMEFFSSNPSADTINRVRGEVNEGLADMLASCATVYYNCCLLRRSYSAKLQILDALLASVLLKLINRGSLSSCLSLHFRGLIV